MTVLGSEGAFDGNAQQVRSIAEQLASSFGRGIDDERHLLTEVDNRIKAQVEAMGDKLKLWILGGLLMQFPVIFLLGGIYSTNNATLTLLQKQQGILDQRGDWLESLARSQQGLEMWAIAKGYEPPRPHDPTP